MIKKPIHYLQYDSRWGNIMFSNHSDKKQTIASSGCGATSSAMVLTTFINAEITPPDVAKIIVDNGYRTYDNGVDWGWFPWMAKHYNLPYKQSYSTDEVIQALKESALIIASMGPGYFTSFGHYVLLWDLDEASQQILVNDPNSTTRTRASYNLFKQQARNYFIFYKGGGVMPEKTAPWKESIKQDSLKEGLITSQDHVMDDIAPKWFVLAVALNVLRQVKK